MVPVPVEEGREGGEELRAAVAVNFWGVGWGHHSASGAARAGPQRLQDAARLVVPSRRSWTPGWGEEAEPPQATR